MKTEVARRKEQERASLQMHRILLIVEIVQRLNYVTLRELSRDLRLEKVTACDRTLRRDLALLVRLQWVVRKRKGNCTKWYWSRPKHFK